MKFIYHREDWASFTWDNERVLPLLTAVRYNQGRLIGRMESLGFTLQREATLQALTQEVIKSSEIEGEFLKPEQVRSSIARRLGIDIGGAAAIDRNVEGIVDIMVDATQNFKTDLTKDRLFGWHAALFPTGRNGMFKITVGAWRNNDKGPMQVVSGPIGFEKVHFQAPDADVLNAEMKAFLKWFNKKQDTDAVLKAAIAHLWFVTIHPFDDGNGRIGRAIADMQLARADNSEQRFYSMSSQIRIERKAYYEVLEKTQKGTLDITMWIEWFLSCLDRALANSGKLLGGVLQKARFWEQHREKPVNPRQQDMLNRLLNGFEGKLTSSKWAKIARCSQDTASRDIQDLIDKDMLMKDEAGGRSTNYLLKFDVMTGGEHS